MHFIFIFVTVLKPDLMKKHIFILLLVLCARPICSWSSETDSQNRILLEQLDKAISERNQYHQNREHRIVHFKERLRQITDMEGKYKFADLLFKEYLHYQTDSALHYVCMKEEIASLLHNGELQYETCINRAEIYGVMSMYYEALLALQKVNPKNLDSDLLSYYYHTYRAYSGWAADYTTDISVRQRYVRQTDLYRDSILIVEDSPIEQCIVRSEKLILSHQEDKAIGMLKELQQQPINLRYQAYVNYTLYEACKAKSDTASQIRYLASTAINDMEMAVREYASLQKLAILMFMAGDYERAYRYLNCSMEDAVACNARLRFIEVAEFYPIIDNTYKLETIKKHHVFIRLLIIISTLAFLLIIALVFLYRWMKKISLMKEQLHLTNRRLIDVNRNLAQTGKIKEVYIAHYLDRCVSYLDKQEQYRRSLEKLAMASKLDELFNAIKSQDFLREERRLFYDEFDKTFLNLFPNFVDDFNNLLTDEGKIFLRSNESLNTELRIFALIRLGVTDASHIAHFLGYSLTTVYNYRSKIRNKAKGDKDLFEKEVMNL